MFWFIIFLFSCFTLMIHKTMPGQQHITYMMVALQVILPNGTMAALVWVRLLCRLHRNHASYKPVSSTYPSLTDVQRYMTAPFSATWWYKMEGLPHRNKMNHWLTSAFWLTAWTDARVIWWPFGSSHDWYAGLLQQKDEVFQRLHKALS